MSLGKLKSMINSLQTDVLNYAPLKGVMLKFEGAGGANPTIVTSYNIASVTRTGIGVYEGTIQQNTFFGVNIFDRTVFAQGVVIAPSVDTDAFAVNFTATGALTFNVSVDEIVQGAGNKLEYLPYDILAGDTVSIGLYLNLGNGELPPA